MSSLDADDSVEEPDPEMPRQSGGGDLSSKFGEASPFVISISVALFIFGALSNCRKGYRLITYHRKWKPPFGQAKKVTRFELFALIFLAFNVASLMSTMVFSLLQVFPLASVCRWKILSEAVFRFATPTSLILVATSTNPCQGAFRSKRKTCTILLAALIWIVVASAPYFFLSEEVVEKESQMNAVTGFPPLATDMSTSQTPNCAFRPSTPGVAYAVFAYSILMAYLVPTGVLVVKVCLFNMEPHLGMRSQCSEEYRRYVINLCLIWVLGWTPCWSMETYQLFLPVQFTNVHQIPIAITHILHTLPSQIALICFPFTCPQMVSDRRVHRRWIPSESTISEVSNDDTPKNGLEIGEETGNEQEKEARPGTGLSRKNQLSQLTHPVSTLLNITLSLTFPLIHNWQPGRVPTTDVCISVMGGEEEETFL